MSLGPIEVSRTVLPRCARIIGLVCSVYVCVSAASLLCSRAVPGKPEERTVFRWQFIFGVEVFINLLQESYSLLHKMGVAVPQEEINQVDTMRYNFEKVLQQSVSANQRRHAITADKNRSILILRANEK